MYLPALRKIGVALGLGCTALIVSACDPSTTTTNAGGSTYHDSMLWNDYYYGHRRPHAPNPPHRPGSRPPRPEHPIARPPIHRPPAGRPRAGHL